MQRVLPLNIKNARSYLFSRIMSGTRRRARYGIWVVAERGGRLRYQPG